VRVDNLFNKQCAGSVIGNEANGRYFEPSPTIAFMVSATAAYTF